MRISDIDITLIDIVAGRRAADPNWEEAIADDMGNNGQITPIEVVETGTRFRLIDGLHRIGARKRRGESRVTAVIKTGAELSAESDLILREIAANFLRRELSVLDKARDVARWREVFETVRGAVTPGRKKNGGRSAPISEEQLDADCDTFAASFTAAAQKALGLNKDAIKRALRIAAITETVRLRISFHPISDNQSELLKLAAQPDDRQEAIAGLILAEPQAAATVDDAIAIIDRIPPVTRPDAWERISDKFGKLPDAAKRRFLIENWDFVEAILAERKAA